MVLKNSCKELLQQCKTILCQLGTKPPKPEPITMKWSESIQNDLCKIWEKVTNLIILFYYNSFCSYIFLSTLSTQEDFLYWVERMLQQPNVQLLEYSSVFGVENSYLCNILNTRFIRKVVIIVPAPTCPTL